MSINQINIFGWVFLISLFAFILGCAGWYINRSMVELASRLDSSDSAPKFSYLQEWLLPKYRADVGPEPFPALLAIGVTANARPLELYHAVGRDLCQTADEPFRLFCIGQCNPHRPATGPVVAGELSPDFIEIFEAQA